MQDLNILVRWERVVNDARVASVGLAAVTFLHWVAKRPWSKKFVTLWAHNVGTCLQTGGAMANFCGITVVITTTTTTTNPNSKAIWSTLRVVGSSSLCTRHKHQHRWGWSRRSYHLMSKSCSFKSSAALTPVRAWSTNDKFTTCRMAAKLPTTPSWNQACRLWLQRSRHPISTPSMQLSHHHHNIKIVSTNATSPGAQPLPSKKIDAPSLFGIRAAGAKITVLLLPR